MVGVDSIAECWLGCVNSGWLWWVMDVRELHSPQLTTSPSLAVASLGRNGHKTGASLHTDGCRHRSQPVARQNSKLDTSEAEGGQHCTFPWEMLRTSKISLNCKQLNHSSLLHAVWAGQAGSGTLMETHGEQ